MYSRAKNIISNTILLTAILITLVFPNHSFAANGNSINCSGITIETDLPDLTSEDVDVPEISQILCPAIRLVNVLTALAMAGFALMIFVSAYKYALAQGDPKALEGAKGTLTFAIFGFVVVLGVFVSVQILQGIFGLDAWVLNPFGKLQEGIQDLIDFTK